MLKLRKYPPKGFTLIELLVVVLIIGILAAIALPQYQRVKEKSEAAQLLTSIKALHEAQQRYYLVNGVFAESIDNLDVEFEGFERGGCEDFTGFPKKDCQSNNKSTVFVSSFGGGISSASLRKTGKYKYSGYWIVEESEGGLNAIPSNHLFCYDSFGKDFCLRILNCELFYKLDENNSFYSCQS